MVNFCCCFFKKSLYDSSAEMKELTSEERSEPKYYSTEMQLPLKNRKTAKKKEGCSHQEESISLLTERTLQTCTKGPFKEELSRTVESGNPLVKNPSLTIQIPEWSVTPGNSPG